MRMVASISSKFLAISYFFDMAPRLFQKVESLTFQKMYGGICHLKWYRWTNFMDLAHGLLMFTTALKVALGFPIHDTEFGHDKGKCTLFYCCFDHYRMLAYKISVCEACIIWRKPTEAFKNPSPIAESRTGKPAMVALKIQHDCSTVRDMTVWANIFVRSHLGCGTDSIFILFCKSHKYFKDAKAMQINRILKMSLIWHVKLNQLPKQ